MKNIHRRLGEKYYWYAKWHEHPKHSLVHWIALVVVTVGIGYLFIAKFVLVSNAQASLEAEAFAQEFGMHVLQEDEYAIVSTGDISSGSIESNIMLKSGDMIPIKTNSGTSVTVVEYDPNSTTYLPSNASGVEIHSLSEFTGYDETGVIDTAITRKLKKQSEVSVIVRMKLPFNKFYEQNDSENSRSDKSKAFDSAKSSIAAVARIKKDLKIINGVSASVNSRALEALSRNPNVEKVDLDRNVTALLDQSVSEIKAPYVWNLIDKNGNTITGNGTTIAIIDTGVDYNHADLGGCLGTNCKVIGGYDFVNNDSNPMDDQGHGTHVAATAAGKGLLNGVAPDAKILAYKVLGSDGSGSFSNVIAAIGRATDPNQDGNSSDHADVISMSLGANCGTYTTGCGPEDSVALAVNNSSAAGVINAIAAGNNGPNSSTVGSPGAASSAITVAAACKKSQLGNTTNCVDGPIAVFSSRGPVVYNGTDYQKPDIAAPGVLICAARWATAFSGSPTCFDSTHIRISGTSMATPHIAGVAALMKQANPTYSPAEIKRRLKDTATVLSGAGYNDQGAGEVNLEAAIPIVQQAKVLPDVWKPVTDPTKKLSKNTQNFSVTSLESGVDSLTMNFVSPDSGITFSSDKDTLDVAGQGTDNFVGTITVDNDVVKPGKYLTTIYLLSNNEKKAAITIPIEVSPTVTSSNVNLDYGIDNPTLSSWASAPISIAFTNKRTDADQTLTISKSTYPTGITYQTSVSSITIPAGETVSLNTSFSVNNSSVPNGVYNGTLSLTSSSNSIIFPTKFSKNYAIKFEGTPEDIKGARVTVYSQSSPERYSLVSITTSPQYVFVNGTGTYDVETWFTNPSCNYGSCGYVIKEGITPNGSSVVLTKSDITRSVTIKPTGIDGNPLYGLPLSLFSFSKLASAGKSSGNTALYVGGGIPIIGVSNTSSNYTMSISGSSYGQENPFYYFASLITANTGNVTVTNTVADLKKLTGNPSLNVPDGATTNLPSIWQCLKTVCSIASSDTVKTVTTPFSHTIYYSTSYPETSQDFALRYLSMYYTSPYFDITSGIQKSLVNSTTFLPLNLNRPLLTGIGPLSFMAGFQNTASLIKVIPPITSTAAYLFRQDYSFPGSQPIPYEISKSGTQVTSGFLPAMNKTFSSATIPQTLLSFATGSGTYQFHAAFPYQITAKNMNADFLASFNTGAADPNPPSIKHIKFYTGGSLSEVYDAAKTNKLEMEFYPNTGTISSMELSYSTNNGTSYSNIQTTNSSGVYTASIPQVQTSGKIAFKVKVTDSANNYMQYTFEMPTTSFVPTPDTSSPTVSITTPVKDATLQNTVAISATAADDVAVDHVDFYSGTTLIGADSSSPYDLSWNTTTVANGAYSLTAKAYDAAGNSGTSGAVSVTVSNTTTIPADTTLPTVSVTKPGNNSTVTGSVTLSAMASDNVGVTKVSFFRGTTLIDTDTTASTTYDVAWDTAAVPDGAYAITAKAYDAAGNIGTSSVINVTVNNTTAPSSDTTAPIISIVSPTNDGTTFSPLPQKGSLKVTANADDISGISTITIAVDGVKVKLCSAVATCTYSWSMNLAKSGSHTISVTAKDKSAAGNTSTKTITGIK